MNLTSEFNYLISIKFTNNITGKTMNANGSFLELDAVVEFLKEALEEVKEL